MLYPLSLTNPKPQLIFTNPSESVILSFQIAIFCGLIAASPFLFFQIWRFLSPQIINLKKSRILLITIWSSMFFFLGCAFCYFTLPIVLNFLVSYAQNRIEPVFKIAEYFGFLLKLSLSFGAVFELPVITFILSKMGLVNARFLLVNSRYAIIAIFIVAAILTPPDVFSQLMLAVPLLLLYGLSIIIALFSYKKSQE